jgi:hypothetical protein
MVKGPFEDRRTFQSQEGEKVMAHRRTKISTLHVMHPAQKGSITV